MILDPSGRGPSALRLGLFGVLIAVLLAAVVYLLGLRYNGAFLDTVEVTARMTSTGDGVPQRADVTFRGVLVGQVAGTDIAARGERQEVRLRIEPALAQRIPATVTVRVVPNNIFGVTAVELVDNGPAPDPLRDGATVTQDTSEVGAQLQTTLTTLRTVLDAIDPIRLATVLGTLADALDPSYRMPGSTIERLDTWTTQVRATPGIGDLLGDLGAAASAVNESAPQLVDTLVSSVTAARTLTEKRANLIALLTAARGAVGVTNTLFARNPDAGPELVGGLHETFGALAADSGAIGTAVANLDIALSKLATVFNWGPDRQMRWVVDVSFTPFTQYTAADCPRYGSLSGPRCGGATVPYTAPEQHIPTQLLPGRLEAAGPPPAVPGLPAIPGLTPSAVVPGPAAPASATAPASLHGVEAIEALVGRPPNAAQLVLLTPVLADGAVQVTYADAPPMGN
ncbi:MCE family protein [Nocardia sp. NPDC050718]|uniref:MlaD family protein n=1 Tax=Nocardia sp. NPDC050718 TaxID=3155788 RepID=UPI0033FAF1F5